MIKKNFKKIALVVCAGTLLQFGGCWGFGGDNWFGRLWTATVAGVASDFLTDNDGVFDLFQD